MNRIIKSRIKGKNYGFRYIMECNYCHKEFSINGMRFNSGVGKFCSFACRTAYRNTTQKGERHNNWKGGRLKTTFGYIRVYVPDHPNNRFGYVLEHRLVMERKLGRYLTEEDVVHHINHNTSDNRIKNLQLTVSEAHSRNHRLAKPSKRDPINGRFVSHK